MSFWEVTLELLKGFQATVIIFAGTLAAALPLGLVVCFGSMCRFAPLRLLTRTLEASRVSPRGSGRPARCWA